LIISRQETCPRCPQRHLSVKHFFVSFYVDHKNESNNPQGRWSQRALHVMWVRMCHTHKRLPVWTCWPATRDYTGTRNSEGILKHTDVLIACSQVRHTSQLKLAPSNLFSSQECRLLGCGAVWVYYEPTFREERVASIFRVKGII
jgi:hypothetical protein